MQSKVIDLALRGTSFYYLHNFDHLNKLPPSYWRQDKVQVRFSVEPELATNGYVNCKLLWLPLQDEWHFCNKPSLRSIRDHKIVGRRLSSAKQQYLRKSTYETKAGLISLDTQFKAAIKQILTPIGQPLHIEFELLGNCYQVRITCFSYTGSVNHDESHTGRFWPKSDGTLYGLDAIRAGKNLEQWLSRELLQIQQVSSKLVTALYNLYTAKNQHAYNYRIESYERLEARTRKINQYLLD